MRNSKACRYRYSSSSVTTLNQTRMNSLARNADSIMYSSPTTKVAPSYFPDSTAQISLSVSSILVVNGGSSGDFHDLK